MQSNLSTNQVKLPFGLKDGKLFHISNVPSGLACKCYCASCGTALVAKKGAKNTHSFAHYNSDECAHAVETALHYAAKQVLEESAQIALPELVITEQVYGEIYGQSIKKSGAVIVCNEHTVIIEDIKLEKRLGQITPDVIAHINGSCFLIEIAVTHFVDDIKDKKLNDLKIPCIEIDLSKVDRTANLDDIRKEVVDSVDNKEWLFHLDTKPIRSKLKSDLQIELQTELDQIFKKEQERKRKEDALRQQKIAEKQAVLEKIQPSIRLLDNYLKEKDKRLTEYSRCLPNLSIWQRAASSMSISNKAVPDFLNHPVLGDSIFACDRRAWQSALFSVFIYGKFSKYDEPYPISVHKMIEWCKRYVPLNRFVFSLWSNKALLDFKISDTLYDFDLYNAVRGFVRHLEKKGFLKFHYQDFYKIQNDNLLINATDKIVTKPKLMGISKAQFSLLFEDEQEAFQERAGILEFCNGLSRKEAEKKAYEIILS